MAQKGALFEALAAESRRGLSQGQLSLCIHAKYPLGTGFFFFFFFIGVS